MEFCHVARRLGALKTVTWAIMILKANWVLLIWVQTHSCGSVLIKELLSTWSFLDSVYVWKSLTNLKEWKVYILNGSLIHGLDRARVPDRGKRRVR